MSDPCTCNLGADECDGQFGVFWPLQDGGSCAVRPCQRPATSTAGWPYNDKVQCAKRIMKAVDTYHGRVSIEQRLFDAAAGKRPMPDAAELRAWAVELGTPSAQVALEAQQRDRALTCLTAAECAACTGTDEHPWCKRTESEWCGRSNPELVKSGAGVKETP